MAEYIGITEAKKRWYELVARAEAGEEFVIGKWGRPLAMLTAMEPPTKNESPKERERA